MRGLVRQERLRVESVMEAVMADKQGAEGV